ncbi:MAG: hypothetical protein ACRD2I_13670 [Vicinamibacterales bacterium]
MAIIAVIGALPGTGAGPLHRQRQPVRRAVSGKQRLHFHPEHLVGAASVADEGVALRRLAIERRGKNVLGVVPLLGVHAGPLANPMSTVRS